MKKKISFLTFVIVLISGLTLSTQARTSTKKILVVYFSHSGNTREVAMQIHAKVGGDIFEVQSVKPYPKDYHTVVEQAKQELSSNYKPELKTKINNIRQYDVVFIGYPIWWGTFPAPIKTFLLKYDLSGKTIVPFCTHGGSELGRSVSDLAKMCPKATILHGLAIRGSESKTSQSKITEWLHKIKFIK